MIGGGSSNCHSAFTTNDRPLSSDGSDNANGALNLTETGKPANIMIIDDDKDIAFTFNTALSPYSKEYNVETFTDAKEALKRFLEVKNDQNKKSDYDIVITDIRMPDLNGIQLYQILKALDSKQKVLFISALDSAQEIISVLPSVKLNEIIKKPVEVNELVQIIRHILSSDL